MYENCKIYGPYKRKIDGRKYITIIYPNNKRSTISYPKYLIECQVNRYLKENETIDHINGNFHDDSIENLRIIDRSEHSFDDSKVLIEKEFLCPICKIKFKQSGEQLHNSITDRKRGKVGPFCSRKCAGTYGRSVQLTGQKLKIKKIIPEYTTNKKLKGIV